MKIEPLRAHGTHLSRAFAFFALALLSGFAWATDLSGTYIWKPVRLGAGGWMRGMVVHPTNPNVRFIRGDVSNAYRWNATNKTWIPMEIASAFPSSVSTAPSENGPGALAVDPSNANIVFVAWAFSRSSDESPAYPSVAINIYKSTDGGITFTSGNLSLPDSSGNPICNETRGERLAVDPNNGQIIYFGSPANGLWMSSDGGASWSAVSGSGAPPANSSVINPRFDSGAGTVVVGAKTVSKRVYATISGGAVVMSNDGGVSWNNISNGKGIDGNGAASLVDGSGNLVVANASASSLWTYSRAGVWSSTACPFTPNGIAVDPSNSNRIFIVDGGTQVARSTDQGAHWISFGYSMVSSDILWLQPSSFRPSPHYMSNGGVYLDANSNLWVPCGNEGCITATPNDAVNTASNPLLWTTAARGIEEMVARPAVIPPGGNPVLTFMDETSFYVSNPDTYNAQHFDINLWAAGNNGLASNGDIAFCPNAPTFVVQNTANVFAGNPTTHNYGAYSTDGGKNWTLFGSIAKGTHPSVLYSGSIAVSPRKAGHLFDPAGADNIVWLSSNIYSQNSYAPFYSSDGGNTWIQTHSFDKVSGVTTSNGYTLLPKQWGMWNPALAQHLLEADPIQPGVFYWNSPMGGFWRSSDGGATWAQTAGSIAGQLANPMHHGQMHAAPDVSGDLWIVDGREGCQNPNNSPSAHGLWHTTDGGTSFSYLSGFDYAIALTLGKAASSGVYPAIYVYGKRTGDPLFGIFRSVDEAATWDRISGYPTGLIDYASYMAASWDTFGLIYVGFLGNSFVYGSPTAITLPARLAGFLNVPLDITVVAPGAAAFTSTPLPPGVSLNPSTGVISGTPTASGTYTFSIDTDVAGSASSTLTVYPSPSRLANISTRSLVDTGNNIQIGGFVIAGNASKQVVIRASGPALGQAPFDIAGVLSDPKLTLYSGQTIIAQSSGWSSSFASTFSQLGAFPWKAGSADSALLISLAPGAYTAQVSGASGDTGVGLIEVYDADFSTAGSNLSNISTRVMVGTGANIEIGGFVIQGSAPKRVLIRASGPALGQAPFDIPGALQDPVLSLYSGQTLIDSNSGWNPQLATDFANVGAFAWQPNSRDSALLETLDPGAYTAQVSGASGDTGIALIEIFDEDGSL